MLTCEETPGERIWAVGRNKPTGPGWVINCPAAVVLGCPGIRCAIFTSALDTLFTIVIFCGAKSIGYILPAVIDLSFSKLPLIVTHYTFEIYQDYIIWIHFTVPKQTFLKQCLSFYEITKNLRPK